MIYVLFILGFVLLIKGADIMIDGSSSIAKKYNISNFVIGLTIVAFGTSMPELVVSAMASIKGSAGIALGNLIGSNMSNTLLILGVSAIIYPLVVRRATISKEIPFSLLAVVAVFVLANDFLIDGYLLNSISRIDGIILILFFIIFSYYVFGINKSKENIFEKIQGEIKEDELKEYNIYLSTIMIIGGIILLAVGGKLIVDGAVFIAKNFGMSESLIALTIVAVGTSLPELAASATAAYKKNTDIAVGNIIGSNIFNFLWVLGASAVIHPIGYDTFLNIDLIILLAITILLMFLIFLGRRNVLGRWEGGVLLFLYFIYLIFIINRG